MRTPTLALFILFTQVATANSLPSGHFQFTEIKCPGALTIPRAPSESHSALILDSSSRTFTLTTEFLGWMGGRCSGRATGTYKEANGEVSLMTAEKTSRGEFTAPCQDVLEILSGTFQFAKKSREISLLSTRTSGVCANASIILR